MIKQDFVAQQIDKVVPNKKCFILVFFKSQFLENVDLASVNLACYAAAGALSLFETVLVVVVYYLADRC